MNWSYVGFVVAASRGAGPSFAIVTVLAGGGVGWLMVFVVGGMLIARGRGKYHFEARQATGQHEADFKYTHSA